MVPLVALVAVYVVDTLLHLDAVSKLLNTGVGFTDTTTFWLLLQPFANSVYTYVTLITAAVVFINTSLGSSVPLVARLLIPATADLDQLNVVPVVPLVGV